MPARCNAGRRRRPVKNVGRRRQTVENAGRSRQPVEALQPLRQPVPSTTVTATRAPATAAPSTPPSGGPASALVERFDIGPYSDFSAKRSNFIRLVICCIDADFCKKIFVGKLLTRSTRCTCLCTAQTSIVQETIRHCFLRFRP